jgi:predicted permease
MLHDLRHAARLLFQQKGWTLVVVLSVALGIGGNVALFNALNALLFKTLDGVDRPDALVRLKWVGENDMVNDSSDYERPRTDAAGREIRATFSVPMFEQLRAAGGVSLAGLAAGAPRFQCSFVSDGQAEVVTAYEASGNFFDLLGVRARLGRTFTAGDDSPSAPPVAVISEGFWKRRFGGSTTVVGKVVHVNDVPVTIVGVAPARFTGIQKALGTAPDVTLPLALDPRVDDSKRLQQATFWWVQIVGRVKPGVSAEQVQGSLDGVFQQAARAGWDAHFASLTEAERGLSGNRNHTAVPSLRVDSAAHGIYDAALADLQSLALVGGVVAALLLIVCANVANLLLSRVSARRKEIAVRLSLGATRARLVRHLLAESLLLAAVGGAAGAVAGAWSGELLRLPAAAASFDWRVFAFAAALTFVTAMIFGTAPALRATGVDVNTALKENARSATVARSTLSKALLVAQVALSLVLLVGAGLFLNTLRNLRGVDVGFDTMNLMIFRVSPGLAHYDAPRAAALYAGVQQRLASLPGVRGVSASQPALLSGGVSSRDVFFEGLEYGFAPGRPEPRGSQLHQVTVSPSFFATLGISLVAGRLLDDRDDRRAPPVVLINQTAARTYFRGANPIGRRFGSQIEKRTQTEIVGVVGDTKYNSLREAAPPTMYFPIGQRQWPSMAVEVRTASDPAAFITAVRDAVRGLDPNLPLTNMTTQADAIEGRVAQERLFAQAYLVFGLLALALASIGLFGVMSYSISRRTNEIGVRMALGARRADVIAMVMRESMIMVAAGIVIGLGGTVVAGRLVASLLFGLSPTDPPTIAGAMAVMVAVSAIAGYLPARRASRLDPMAALRCE